MTCVRFDSFPLSARVLGLFLTALASLAAAPASAQPGVNGRVVFASRTGGNGPENIYSRRSDGSQQRRLTVTSATDRTPIPSPDGSYVAFIRSTFEQGANRNDIYVVRANGTGEFRVTTDRAGKRTFAWSPDSASLVFEDESGDIFTVKRDGTARVLVAARTATFLPSEPVFTADGARVIYSGTDLTNAGVSVIGRSELFSVRTNGTENTRILATADGTFVGGCVRAPNGTRLACTRERLVITNGTGAFHDEVVVLDPTGQNLRVVSVDTDTYDENVLDWSYGTDRLLVAREHRTSGADVTLSMRPDGTDRVQALAGAFAGGGRFSPDGKRVVYRYGVDTYAPHGVRHVALNGSDERVVTTLPDRDATWAPLFGEAALTDDAEISVWSIFGETTYTGPVVEGDLDKSTRPAPFFASFFSGSGTVRTAAGIRVALVVSLSNYLVLGQGWQGTIRVQVQGESERVYDMSGATVDFAAGTVTKSWSRTSRVCTPGGGPCIDIPIVYQRVTYKLLADRI